MSEHKNHILLTITLLVIGWGLLVVVNALRADWSGPIAPPPEGNPSSFLTSGPNPETKTGQLMIDNDFYVTGYTNLGGTSAPTPTSARVVITPISNAAIDAGNGFIRTEFVPVDDYDVVTKTYLISSLSGSNYWTLSTSTNSIYPTSTDWKVAIGTTTAGTGKLVVMGGNVGIGTINPGAPLEIKNNLTSGYVDSLKLTALGAIAGHDFTMTNSYGRKLRIRQYNSNSTGPLSGTAFFQEGGGSLLFLTGQAQPIYFATNNRYTTPDMILDSSGSVGIGTTSPNAKLDVNGSLAVRGAVQFADILYTGSNRLLMVDSAGNVSATSTVSVPSGTTGQTLRYGSNAWEVTSTIYVANSGNVGISTTSPMAALHIYPRTDTEGVRVVSSNYSPLVIRDSTDWNDLFRVNQSGDVTAVTSSATRMRSNNYCDADGANCFDPSGGWGSVSYFATVTSSTYNGNNNGHPGYAYAHARCKDQLAGSHVCSAEEILNTIRENKTMPTVGVWIFNGPPGYEAVANDCAARTIDSAGTSGDYKYGSYWQAPSDSYPQGKGLLMKCNVSLKLACCL